MTIHELGTKFHRIFNFHPPLMHIMLMVSPTDARIDIIKLDEELSKRDPDYDSDKCTYGKLKNISMSEYIKLKYGDEAAEFVKNNF